MKQTWFGVEMLETKQPIQSNPSKLLLSFISAPFIYAERFHILERRGRVEGERMKFTYVRIL